MSDLTRHSDGLVNWVAWADLLTVGAGAYAAAFVESGATTLGPLYVVIDWRIHIGGSSYSDVHKETGAEVHQYSAHLFHLPNDTPRDYANHFSDLQPCQHLVSGSESGGMFALHIDPVIIWDLSERHIPPHEFRLLIEEQSQECGVRASRNLEEEAISSIEHSLYEAFFRGSTLRRRQDDPYYPIYNSFDSERYRLCCVRAGAEGRAHCGSRLGTYRYWGMHQGIGATTRDTIATIPSGVAHVMKPNRLSRVIGTHT